ncbi:MAG TPA: DUF1801 domain-containing protein [Patescibacteria group bacterium]|nr:DUF1801 domain-containing protein [Patescibacteria group bacterium]
MNMFKSTTAKTPDEYIALIAEPRRSEIQQLHTFIQKTVPKQKPFIISGMIGYGSFHYKSASGREGEWAKILLASQKNYISVYVCAVDGKQYIPEKYKKDFPKASIGRSCIRFKKIADIDLVMLKKVLIESEKFGFGI